MVSVRVIGRLIVVVLPEACNGALSSSFREHEPFTPRSHDVNAYQWPWSLLQRGSPPFLPVLERGLRPRLCYSHAHLSEHLRRRCDRYELTDHASRLLPERTLLSVVGPEVNVVVGLCRGRRHGGSSNTPVVFWRRLGIIKTENQEWSDVMIARVSRREGCEDAL